MAELIGALFLGVAVGATVVALLTTLSLLAPDLAGRTSRAVRTMPGRSFLLGTVNFLFFFAVAVVLSQIGQEIGDFFGGLFGLAALSVSFVLLLLLLIGLTGLVVLLAGRLAEGAPPTTGRVLRAGALLTAGALTPVAGWFVLLPLAALTALGAAIIAVLGWGRQFIGGRGGSQNPA